ncbi:uncharacterized protein LOC143352645 isoform X2 [Halictus rubicundus]
MSRDAVHKSNYTVMNLYCRPKGDNSLICRLGNCRGQSMDLTNENQLDMSEEIYQRFCDADPFEVKFNERGIEHLVVHENLHVSVLNDLKLIAECLNIGVDLNGIPDGTFNVQQNTTIGRCNLNVGINHYPSKGPVNKMRNHRYKLEPLRQLNKVAEEAIVIQKTTNLSDCTRYASFYFGSYGNTVVEPDLRSHLESTISRIFISDVRFVSSLTRSGTLGSDNTNDLVAITEYLSVTLRDIRAAQRELMPDVPDAWKTSIEVNSEVNKISKME